MERSSLELPDVTLEWPQRLGFAVVALLVAFAVLRVSPDLVRAVYPLNLFGYVTDAAGVVKSVSPTPPIPYRDLIRTGDRIVISRVPAFDRKPGLVGTGYSRDNPIRTLPVEREHRIVTLHPGSHREAVVARVTAVLRVLLFLVGLIASAMLVLVRPSFATGAIFVYCLGADAPTTFSEVVFDNPWQQIPVWIADVLHGTGRVALLAFAGALIWPDGKRGRTVAIACGLVGLGLGTLNAYAQWLATYAGAPHPALVEFYGDASSFLTVGAVAAFVYAYVRARKSERRRIGWIAAAFAFAGVARLASDSLYPVHLTPLQNGALLTMTILPIGVVWFSVIRHRAFDVDFVVGRAVVYVAISAAVIGTLGYIEEIATYVFYQNVDLAYGFLIVIFTFVGMATGRITEFVKMLVDRFVFRDRLDRHRALEFIAGYILDAEHVDDVYRALLEDVAHALSLQFAGTSDLGDDRAAPDVLADLDQIFFVVRVDGDHVVGVAEQDEVAVAALLADEEHGALVGGAHRRARRRGQVDAVVLIARAAAEGREEHAVDRPDQLRSAVSDGGGSGDLYPWRRTRRDACLRMRGRFRRDRILPLGARDEQTRAGGDVGDVADAVLADDRLHRDAVAVGDSIKRLARFYRMELPRLRLRSGRMGTARSRDPGCQDGHGDPQSGE